MAKRAFGEDSFRITVGYGDWIFIDGTMDNEGSTADVNGQTARSELCWSVRDAGSKQMKRPRGKLTSAYDLPEPGPESDLGLTADQWALVVAELESGAEINDSIGEPDVAARERRIASRLKEALANAGLTDLGS